MKKILIALLFIFGSWAQAENDNCSFELKKMIYDSSKNTLTTEIDFGGSSDVAFDLKIDANCLKPISETSYYQACKANMIMTKCSNFSEIARKMIVSFQLAPAGTRLAMATLKVIAPDGSSDTVENRGESADGTVSSN